MTPAQPRTIAINEAVVTLGFLPDRTPTTPVAKAADAFRRLADYREGAIFVGHWAGTSEWERHTAGDEIVMVLEGRTTIFFLSDKGEVPASLGPNELVVVPKATWHRFETQHSVTVLSVTPEPTDHSSDLPS